MSTRTREGAPPGKEKRGASLTPSGRSIPSYLRPTAASMTNDVPKLQSKKPASTTVDKPALARRRSFDMPPSHSRPIKPPVSLGPTLRSSSLSGKPGTESVGNKPVLSRRRSFDVPPSPSRSIKPPVSPASTLRSSSLKVSTESAGNKPALSRRSSFDKPPSPSRLKGVPVRNLKEPKDAGKRHALHARPVSTVKKSSALPKKHEPGIGSSRKERVAGFPQKVVKPDIQNLPESEPQSDDQESAIAEEQTLLGWSSSEKESEDSLLEDQEMMDMAETVSEQPYDKIVMVESHIILEKQNNKIVTAEHEEASIDANGQEDQSHVEEISNQQEEIKEDTAYEMNFTDTDESVAGNAKEEAEDKEAEEEEEEEMTARNEKEEVDSGSESDDLKEKEVVVEETKDEEIATPRVAHGKELELSNNVIEETKNKHIEQRKNRVKALARAFETVISLQG